MKREHHADNGRRFGQFLRRVRENRKLSLDAAAELTARLPGRVTKSHLSRIENGSAEPTFPRMFSLARVYGVPIAQFAERFEADLRRSLIPPEIERLPSDVLFEDGETLRKEGRHDEALLRYDLIIERARAKDGSDPPRQSAATLRLRRVACLLMLSRYAWAKDECEELLAARDVTPAERAMALQLFAQCCYRLERYDLALMAIRQAEDSVASFSDASEHRPHLLQLKGNLLYVTGDARSAANAFRDAMEAYEAIGIDQEVCKQRLNYGEALSACGKYKHADRELRRALAHAESRGYARTKAMALGALGAMAFKQDRLDAAESCLLQSNALARQRDYRTLLFCNSYYLWRIALERDDATAATACEATLRTYVDRMPAYIPEVHLYRSQVAGGQS